MIVQPGFNRDILACEGSVRIHEITSCGADYITGHFKSGQLYRQLSFFPPVICIQKCHISAFRNRHTTVTGTGSTEISLIFYINKIRSVFPWNENFPGSINRAVINDNQLQWYILRINRLHCPGDVFLTIIYGHDHRYLRGSPCFPFRICIMKSTILYSSHPFLSFHVMHSLLFLLLKRFHCFYYSPEPFLRPERKKDCKYGKYCCYRHYSNQAIPYSISSLFRYSLSVVTFNNSLMRLDRISFSIKVAISS